MARHEVGLGTEVGAADQVRPEPQVRDGDRAGLLGVVDEVALGVVVGVAADDLDRVLVRADRPVGAETVEHALEHVFLRDPPGGVYVEACSGHVVVDSHREMGFRCFGGQVIQDRLDHRGREFLGAETVPAADHPGRGRALFGQRGLDVRVERFPDRARFFCPVQHADRFHGVRERVHERLRVERTVEAHLEDADLLALRYQVAHGLMHGLGPRTHHDDHALGVRGPDVVEQVVLPTGQCGELVHLLLHDTRGFGVVSVYRFPSLEIDVRVLRRAAEHGPVRAHASPPVGDDGVLPDHFAHDLPGHLFDLLDLVGTAEPVEEVEERHAALQRGGMGDRPEIGDFLDACGGQERESC